MGKPAAKQGDKVTAVDKHLIQPPGPSSPVIVPHPFNGTLSGNLSTNVNIMGKPAAVVGSTATNQPHIPSGGSFVVPPQNLGRIMIGSTTVFINGKPAARAGDTATTCNDPVESPGGRVQAAGTVNFG